MQYSIGGLRREKYKRCVLLPEFYEDSNIFGKRKIKMEIRRQSVAELTIFRRRWQRAVEEDKNWVDPFEDLRKKRNHLYKKPMPQYRRPK